ncbi:apolipoprotein B-100-like [Melanotaenia boesemani]|uniref:apolipoprotein B-100-like n=1 Tax=Melanotaenia boesemani TaxID=1250792 RepID=UPI001C059630|nr:apolipoprotein B-100-like [Melanotaenia boesemani]
MWDAKLCLLLLLGTYTLAQQDVGSAEEESPVCFLAKRYKNFNRFVYNYEAETFNSVNGATDNKSGAKVSCTVEVDVPQMCSFILRTTECSLGEIFDVNDEGKPVYRPAAGAEAFKAEMAKNPLKIVVEGQTNVKLYPEDDEPVNILNIKRGIVSALMVPDMDEKENKQMPTVHGVCSTDFTVNSREDSATDVTISRDLSACDWFTARRQDTSPLALISGMNYPLSKMISSTQTCNYKFDSQKKHMTSGACTEKHIFLPFSHKNEYGISAMVKQTVTLKEMARTNDRVFDHNEANLKHLPMDVTDDKSLTKDAAISTMQKLNDLSRTTENEKRAGLFHELVSELRGLKADILGSTVNEMMDISSTLTWQALAQCGTPECTSTMLTVLRTFDTAALEVDTVVYALGLLSNPSRTMVKDLLAMAQYKQSKPIMYALSHVARRLYISEGITPEITAVSTFMASLLGEDCSGEKELTFLTLRVIGNMGDAMEAADPTIKATMLKCMRQPATTLSVQLAAIQAFRRMSVTDETRANLQRVSQYPKGAVQKRLAAYLILMRNPQDSDIEMVKKLLTQEQSMQIKAFVSSHIYNIISSTDSETKMLGKKILDALQDTDVATHNDYTTKSRNYKLGVAHESMLASIEGNVIFDPSNQLPREVLLETTLKAFGYSMDIWELGMDVKNFEPSIEALFGQNGFFPDTVSKALYWAEDKMPPKVKEVLEKWVAPLKSKGQKVPENLMKEIVRNFNKLVKDLQSQDTPEAMAYLKIMGAELGYIKGSDMKFIAQNAMTYADIFMRIIPTQVLTKLISSTDNEMFAHYIFMDNKFIMPTASGMPLKFGLSGTFAPGAKGGIQMTPRMKELVFSPSVGVEFVTQMGVHVPEFVASAVEMHTSMYHESAFNAKITMEENQVKLSIPAPQDTTKFFRISNKVLIVGAGQASVIPHRLSEANCSPLFSGVKYCTTRLHFGDVDKSTAPYFPLNGETLFAVDIKPTKEVSEYTATIAYELLSEGKDGHQKVDSLKMTLRAEGSQPTEATATMKYNRNRNVFTTKVQIPDFDVEAGIKIGITDNSAKGKSITLEISNKKVPQLTLIGQAKLQAMTDGMLQVQLLVPSLRTDATISATMNKAEGLTMQIKSDVKLPEVTSIQAVTFKYGKDQAEIQLMSNMNADTKIPVHYTEALRIWLRQFSEKVMDQQVINTDMKLRHIFNKGIEASNIWMDKISADVPYLMTLKEQIAMVEIPSVPENLFMNFESTFRYQFNQNRFMISIPLPLGGKSSEELRIPPVITSPQISLPQLEFELAPQKIQIPSFTIPSDCDLTLPLLGMMEVSAKVNSNFYDWEGMIIAGNSTLDSPSYVAKISIMAESPIKLLSFSAEGNTKITDTAAETIELTLDGLLNHMLITTGFSVLESIAVTDNVLTTGRYNMHAKAPLGLDTSMTITTQLTLDSTMLFGDVNTDGSVTVGPMTATTTYLHTFSVEPAKKEVKMESTLRVTSEILKLAHKIKASYENDEYLFESNTNVNCDPIKHTTKINLNFKDAKLSIQSDSVTKADEKMHRSQLEISASGGQATLRIENQADDTQNRAYSLLTGALNPSGLEINADASMNIFSSLASHKATLTLNTNGLTTSCTTTAQHSPVTFENIFHGGVDTSGATLSLTTKGAIRENKAELTVEGKLASTEVYLNSMFKANLFDINSRNRVNLRLNEDGLVLSNNIVGSFREIRTENTNSLSLTLRSFTLQSKTDNFLDKSNSYMHDITVNMERFTASAIVKNDLKVMSVNFVNDALFKAEPYNIEMAGTLMGTFSEEELKHTYEIKFVDMILSAKCNTNGKLLGSHMTHSTDIEVAGLTVKFNNAANFNSPSLRLDSTVKTVAAPFTLNIDAIFNSNGAVYLYGEQSGELYSKFLLKAEPTLFTQSFEYRASTSHEIAGRPAIKTNMDNKFNSMLSLQEQSVILKITSTINEHNFDQEMTAYNNAERMGVEMKGAVSTPFFGENKQDYGISGFVKYDKNSDSHFIQIPFIEHLPVVIENMKTTVMKVLDHSMEMLRDINTRYEISAKFQGKVAEMKDVIDNFDFNLFVQDLKKFINSVENFITNMASKFPTDKVMDLLRSIKNEVREIIQKYNIPNRLNAIYTKIEEFLSNYEVEKMIATFMDEVVKIMKQYQVREKIQDAFNALRSIDIQPLLKKVMMPVQELVDELYSFDFKQLIDDMSDYFIRMIQKLKSFHYETFSVELMEKMAEMSKIPCFGKLYSELRIISPHYNFRTTADLENTTVTSETPEFKMNLNSQAESTLRALDFTVDASAHFAAPKMNRLSISENIKVVQSSFTLDHKATMTLYGLSGQASAETTAKATTELYVAELANKAFFAVGDGVSASMDTSYNHDLNVPPLNIFSKTTINQKTVFGLESGTIRLTFNNLANEKYDIQDFSDEAKHKSDMEVTLDLHTAKLTFTGETGSKHFKINQDVVADICIYRHAIIEAKFETEAPFIKSSIAEVKFQAKVEDMKIDFTASHNTELDGQIEGTLSNSALALITPTELMFDTKNKGNAKVFLPFELTGKVDLQNDIAFTLNSEVHQASWTGLARFNQYKYSHFFSVENGEKEINIISQISGEGDFDMLKEPFTIPEITVPLVDMTIPKVEEFSLWEDTGLSYLLTTTQQTFDMNSKLKYVKNPEMITININLDPVINAINTNFKALHKKVLISKDKVATILASPYGKAKEEYEKYSIELPKTITIPAYKVPVMNIEMSSFTIPVPDVTVITMPTLHVPSALSKMTIPKITLPKIQSIKIPVMGDLTYEFTMKTAIATLQTDASILNQDGLKVKLDVSSKSDFELLAGKIEGTTNVNTVGEFKMASAMYVKHFLLEGNHESDIILSFENAETSITNSAKVHLPHSTKEIYQVITANPVEGLVVSMSSPSAGHIAVQVQTKRPAQVKARVYGRYPTEPTTDIDIFGVKMSVVDSEMLNLQTTWNTEMPYEMMLELKKHVPMVTDMVSDTAAMTNRKINRLVRSLKGSFEKARKQGKAMFRTAIDYLATVNSSDVMTTVSRNIIMILSEYQRKFDYVLGAIVKFLRETKFQIPGYKQRLSGLEVYQKCSAFVADVTEEALEKFPEYFASMFAAVIDEFKAIEFNLPGSEHIVRGKEILDDLFVALRKIQDQLIVTVRKLGEIQLDDIFKKIVTFQGFAIQQSEKLLQTLKSQNVKNISGFVSDVYNDAINSRILADVVEQVEEIHRVIVDYLKSVANNIQNILADMSTEQLRADIQSWIDSSVKRINTFHNNVIRNLQEKSKNIEPYVRVGDRKIDVDIPLPFVVRFN